MTLIVLMWCISTWLTNTTSKMRIAIFVPWALTEGSNIATMHNTMNTDCKYMSAARRYVNQALLLHARKSFSTEGIKNRYTSRKTDFTKDLTGVKMVEKFMVIRSLSFGHKHAWMTLPTICHHRSSCKNHLEICSYHLSF